MGRPSKHHQNISSYLNNLGISRANTRWQALIQPEVQPFVRHLLLAPSAYFVALQTEMKNSTFLFVLAPPLELLERKDFAGSLSLRIIEYKQTPHEEDTASLSVPWRQGDACGRLLGEQQVTGRGPLQFFSQATILRCFCGKLPAQDSN